MSITERGSENPTASLPADPSMPVGGDTPTFVIPAGDGVATAEFPVDSTFTTANLRVIDPAEARVPAAARPAGSRWRRVWTDLAALAGFLLLATWIVGPYWSGRRVSASDESDQAFFEWMLAHGAQVLTHFQSPLYTTQMNVPGGVNLMANTSILALSIPMAPVTLLFGPAASYALLLVLGLAGTAAAWYYLLSRHIVRSRSAALLGALLAGFGPAMVAHASGHPNIVAEFLVPFIVWRVLRLREPGHAIRNGVLLGLLTTVQVFINEEILFITAIALAILLTALAVAHRDIVRQQVKPFLAATGVAAFVAVSLLAYPLWQQFFGPASYHGLNEDLQSYGTDLVSFASFGGHTVVGQFTTNAKLSPNPVEQNAFFGWPLILTFGVAIYWLRRRPLAIALAVTGLVLSIFSFGRYLIVNGTHTSIPMPWYVLSKLPIFDSVVPTRMSLLVLPILAVIIAMAHDHVIEAYGRRAKPASGTRLVWPRLAWSALVMVALATVLPVRVETVAASPAPTFIAAGTWKKYVDTDQTVVPVPLPDEDQVDALFWAAEDNLELSLPRGYFLGPDPAHGNQAIFGAPDRHTTTLLAKVEATGKPAVIHATDRKDAIADLRYWHAAVVVQVPGDDDDKALRATLTDLLGFKPKWSGGVWVWDVRRLLAGKRSVLG